jgi:threonine/homoserine/homoserine lactone efflux protein
MRERARGWVMIVVSVIGLAAEITSTIQDGIGAPKVVALACFAFLFWYGWELAHRAKPGAASPDPKT